VSTPFQQALIALTDPGYVRHASAVETKRQELRNIGLTAEQVDRVCSAALARARKSIAPNRVAIEIVLDVALYKARRGIDHETLLAELEAIS
jgi:hypothetical protein